MGTRRAQDGGQRGPQGIRGRLHLDGQMLGSQCAGWACLCVCSNPPMHATAIPQGPRDTLLNSMIAASDTPQQLKPDMGLALAAEAGSVQAGHPSQSPTFLGPADQAPVGPQGVLGLQLKRCQMSWSPQGHFKNYRA